MLAISKIINFHDNNYIWHATRNRICMSSLLCRGHAVTLRYVFGFLGNVFVS